MILLYHAKLMAVVVAVVAPRASPPHNSKSSTSVQAILLAMRYRSTTANNRPSTTSLKFSRFLQPEGRQHPNRGVKHVCLFILPRKLLANLHKRPVQQ